MSAPLCPSSAGTATCAPAATTEMGEGFFPPLLYGAALRTQFPRPASVDGAAPAACTRPRVNWMHRKPMNGRAWRANVKAGGAATARRPPGARGCVVWVSYGALAPVRAGNAPPAARARSRPSSRPSRGAPRSARGGHGLAGEHVGSHHRSDRPHPCVVPADRLDSPSTRIATGESAAPPPAGWVCRNADPWPPAAPPVSRAESPLRPRMLAATQAPLKAQGKRTGATPVRPAADVQGHQGM